MITIPNNLPLLQPINKEHPIVLLILDGWGHRETTEHNAISAAVSAGRAPFWRELWLTSVHTLISGSGTDVGLPSGQMGNSEVGHLNIGAGRVVYQDLTRIDRAIETGTLAQQPVLMDALNHTQKQQKALHIMGLLSPGGVHSHERHMQAVLELAAANNIKHVFVHAFLDGRDVPPRSAMASIQALEDKMQILGCGKIASIIGRYYPMDRDKRWDRVQQAYDLLTGSGDTPVYHARSAVEGLQLAYDRGETDEFVKATVICDAESPVIIGQDDTVIFMNYRSDRARELTHAFVDSKFSEFPRTCPVHTGLFITLTQYATDINIPVIFPPTSLNNMLGSYLSELGLRQLRIAETEKYAHVTFFFNGGVEAPAPGEDRCLIPSPKVATYDLQPEMSAPELTDKLVAAIHSQTYDFIVCNYANPDMVGHTGNFDAAVQAIEVIDTCLAKVVDAVRSVGGEVIITADHGNAECMYDEATHQAHTAHTSDPVPFVYVGRSGAITHTNGTLSDIAPTILYLMGIPQPREMTGKTLLKLEKTV
jgi:2,3-bisphosphoglycerate-independent phosphoglycerate mutase